MQGPSYPATRDLVLVGGGHAHALVLRQWGIKPMPGVRLTVIDPDPSATYTGMLPGLIAGHYQPRDLMIDLVRLARFAGGRLVLGRVARIDRQAKLLIVPGRPDIAYDVLSLDIGITSDMPELPGFTQFGVPAKPLGRFAEAWAEFVAGAAGAAHIVVLGAGVAGVELALAIAERLRAKPVPARITVVEAGQMALPGIGARARAALLATMAARGIQLLTGAKAISVDQTGVVLADGRRIAANFVLGAAGACPQGWLNTTGLALENGYVAVGPTLQSLTDPAIFAVGDCAYLTHAPRPKAGVFAVRQAPVLHENLRAALSGGRLQTYWPQRDYLKLISTGARHAVADKFGLPARGAFLWRLKDRIDRQFMEKLLTLPGPPVRAIPARGADGLVEMLAEAPLCGGCGAKVGRGELLPSLAGVPLPRRADVVSGPGDDAAILRSGAGFQVITTDHLRALTDDPVLMVRIAAVHAMGDVWAMGAVPQVALAQIILPQMSPRLQARTLAEINRAAADLFTGEGVDVVGGHTSIGSELTIGFTITGLRDVAPLTKGGAQAGDVVVLTKPIGTGVILAGEMARLAPGDVVAAAWHSMARSQRVAAGILAGVAHAMTDVTGFGLAGHLEEMLAASGVGAVLYLRTVPVLPGAEALAAQGVRSSLYPANRAAASVGDVPATPLAELLFDPQTGGGLLAAIPADQVAAVLARLALQGIEAVAIAQLVPGVPRININSEDRLPDL